MNIYSKMTTQELERRLEKANNKIPKLKTVGGLWAIEHEIKFCIEELNKRGVKIESKR